MTESVKNILKQEFHLSDDLIEIIRRADAKSELRTLFLENKSDVSLFRPLKYLDWFNPATEPLIEEVKAGRFHVPYWNVLTYIEKISKLETFAENVTIREDVITFIKDVCKFKMKSDHHDHFDNYRTN